jgi:protocatechuate 3,4-dioxygenase beta subunit
LIGSGGISVRRVLFLCATLVVLAGGVAAAQCKPTEGGILDPGYTPTAPKRASVGSGLVITGTIFGDDDCKPIPGATVEFWLTGPNGYTDNLRGTVVADGNGRYRFESPFPASSGFAPHIHMNVAADGFVAIQTTVFPKPGASNDAYDIVLDIGD